MNFANWKTTLMGISAILMAGSQLLSELASGNLNSVLTYIPIVAAGAVGLFAKDHNVTGGTTPQ